MSSETAGKLIFKKYTLHVIQSCSIEILNVATPIFNILTSHRNTKSKPQMYKLHEIVNNNKVHKEIHGNMASLSLSLSLSLYLS